MILPPAAEQREIVARIATDTAKLNTALTRTEREIGLLREYRTRLVADVVTGKLDVRAAARQLPATSTGPESAVATQYLPDEAELEPINSE